MYNAYPCSYCPNAARCSLGNMYNAYRTYSYPYYNNTPMYRHSSNETGFNSGFGFSQPMQNNGLIPIRDYGPKPYVVNINEATKQNDTYRTALWTGTHLQLTLMSLNVGEDIGLEIHPNVDQFLRVEEGQGIVMMGKNQYNLDFRRNVSDDFAILIPAGTWHNVVNTGNTPLKLYSIYAPPQHPHGTVHETKAEAMAAEEHHDH